MCVRKENNNNWVGIVVCAYINHSAREAETSVSTGLSGQLAQPNQCAPSPSERPCLESKVGAGEKAHQLRAFTGDLSSSSQHLYRQLTTAFNSNSKTSNISGH